MQIGHYKVNAKSTPRLKRLHEFGISGPTETWIMPDKLYGPILTSPPPSKTVEVLVLDRGAC